MVEILTGVTIPSLVCSSLGPDLSATLLHHLYTNVIQTLQSFVLWILRIKVKLLTEIGTRHG